MTALFWMLLTLQGRPDEQGGAVEQQLNKPKTPIDQPEKPKPQIELPDRQDTKPQDDKIKIKVSRIKVTGNTVIDSQTLQEIVEPYNNTELTLTQLKEIANKITLLYREEGYILAWAYVPAQDIKDGVVEIAVVEGRVDKVVVGGNNHYTSEFIFKHLEDLQGGPVLTQGPLERALLLLNDYQNLQVRVTLRPGEKQGTTDLYFDAMDEAPYRLSFDYDNYGSQSISRDRFGMSVSFADLWDEGHVLSLRGLVGERSEQLQFVRMGYEMPIGADGLKLAASVAHMNFVANGVIPTFEPNGDGPIYSIGASYPFVKTRMFSLTGQVSFEGRDIEQKLGNIRTSYDHLRVMSYTLSMDATDSWYGRTIVSFEFRDGLGDLFGGTRIREPSRAQASDDFDKFSLQVYRIQRIMDGFFAIIRWTQQYSPSALLSSEQFGLGGNDSVRGFNSFEYAGDWGYSASVELRVVPPGLADLDDPFTEGRKIGDVLQIAFFGDWGEAGLHHPRAGERDVVSFESVGVGLRVTYPLVTIRFDAGFPLSQARPARGEDGMLYLQVVANIH